MLKRYTSILMFLFLIAATPMALAGPSGVASAAPATAAAPVRVTVWTWLVKIQNINYPANELTVDMFVTFTYDLRSKDRINPMKHFEIVQAKSMTLCEQDEESRPAQGEYYQTFRCVAVIGHLWDIRSFPFDRHAIRINIEDSTDKAGTLVFVAAPDNGREEIPMRDRKIADYSVLVGEHKWGWGDTFSTYEITFTLEPQHPWGMFQKLFLTVFIALAVALLSFHIHPTGIDPRFGLLVGSLFAAIANQYVVSNSLPLAGTVTLVDTIHELAYLVILLCLCLSLVSLRCVQNDRVALSQRIDRWSFRVLLTAYVVITAVVVANAAGIGQAYP